MAETFTAFTDKYSEIWNCRLQLRVDFTVDFLHLYGRTKLHFSANIRPAA